MSDRHFPYEEPQNTPGNPIRNRLEALKRRFSDIASERTQEETTDHLNFIRYMRSKRGWGSSWDGYDQYPSEVQTGWVYTREGQYLAYDGKTWTFYEVNLIEQNGVPMNEWVFDQNQNQFRWWNGAEWIWFQENRTR